MGRSLFLKTMNSLIPVSGRFIRRHRHRAAGCDTPLCCSRDGRDVRRLDCPNPEEDQGLTSINCAPAKASIVGRMDRKGRAQSIRPRHTPEFAGRDHRRPLRS